MLSGVPARRRHCRVALGDAADLLERAGRDDDEHPRDRDQHDGREGDDEVDGMPSMALERCSKGEGRRRPPHVPRRRRAGSPRSWGQRPAPGARPRAENAAIAVIHARTAGNPRGLSARGRVSGAWGVALCAYPLSVHLRRKRPPVCASGGRLERARKQQYLRPSNRSERSQRFPAASAAAARLAGAALLARAWSL